MIDDREDSHSAGSGLQDEAYVNVAKCRTYTFVSRPQKANGVSPMQKRWEGSSRDALELEQSHLFCCKKLK